MTNLFTPFSLRQRSFANRLVVAPMCQYSAVDGVADDYHLVHLGRFALGGFAAVIVEATGVTAEGRITAGCLGLWDDRQIGPLRRIVDFINHLEVAKNAGDKEAVKQIVYDCVDYTLSHFAFEESLQEEAGYAYCKPHKKVHELFARKVSEYQERMDLGDDVAEELHATLARWLVNHIKRDDADYVESVRASMAPGARALAEEKKKTGWFRRLFGR